MGLFTRRQKENASPDPYPHLHNLRSESPVSKRWWYFAFTCSLVIHLWLAVYLIMTGPGIQVMPSQQQLDSTFDRARTWADLAAEPRKPVAHKVSMRFVPPSPPDAAGPDQAADPSTQSSTEALQEMAARQRERIAELDDAERLAELRHRTSQLNNMDDKAVRGTVSRVESMLGVPDVGDRALAPREGAQGDFDTQTMVLYDITKTQNKQGQTVYRHIWVDAKGLSWSHDRLPNEMDSSEIRMAEIYDMVRENPSLRPLLESVLKMDAARNAK